MATAANSNPHLLSGTPADEEHWDEAIEVLLSAGEVEAARAEFERQCLASIDSGAPILMTPEKWEELRLELHREAKLTS